MSAHKFLDDDAAYLTWLAAHPDGYVINIARSYSATTARAHRAGCRTISGQNPGEGAWTGPYVKVCAEQLAELDRWALYKVWAPISPCFIGSPPSLRRHPRGSDPLGPHFQRTEPGAAESGADCSANPVLRWRRAKPT